MKASTKADLCIVTFIVIIASIYGFYVDGKGFLEHLLLITVILVSYMSVRMYANHLERRVLAGMRELEDDLLLELYHEELTESEDEDEFDPDYIAEIEKELIKRGLDDEIIGEEE